MKNVAAGINKDDVYCNLNSSMPTMIPGYNASGNVVEVGANVNGFESGDSVVYLSKNMGCY